MPDHPYIPTVDLGWPDASARIDEACRRSGFFIVVGHGVDPSIIDAAWSNARAFFDLPIDDRMAVAMPYSGYPYGYSPLAGERLAASLAPADPHVTPPDLKESFAVGPVVPPGHRLSPGESFAWSANLWPATLPDMRCAWEQYYLAVADLAARLLATMADGLGLQSGWFAPLIDRHTSALRALNYPGRDPAYRASAGQLGAGAHSDYGTITILLADPVEPGLEVFERSTGMWHPVEPAAGAFVVNLGDALARWTNDRWASTLHRVRVPDRRRQSIAFFHNANWDAVIECLPNCLDPGEAPRYAPMEAGPHLMSKFTATVIGS